MWTDVYGDMQEFGATHRHMRRIIRGLIRGLDYDSVLDVGCGMGHNLRLLCRGRALRQISGIDISAHAIDKTSATHEGDFYLLDIEESHLAGRWDLVLCSLLLEHLQDDVSALHNIRAMTGKYLVLSTIAGDYDRYRAWESQVGHVRNYSVGELESKLNVAGFAVQKVVYWGFPFYSPLSRTLQNLVSVRNRLGVKKRLVAEIMYYIGFLNSNRRGDLLVILAEARGRTTMNLAHDLDRSAYTGATS
jgi:SAM-dependent methyltransferase